MWQGERVTATNKHLHSKKEKHRKEIYVERKPSSLSSPHSGNLQWAHRWGSFLEMWHWTWAVLPWKWEARFFSSRAPHLSTFGNSDRFFSFVERLLWKWPCLFPNALEDCIVRPHYNQITQEGDFSFPFLKLDPYLCANTREIETFAERGPLSGVPGCHGSQTRLLHPQYRGRHVN